ncbi:MAG: hypothetical protein ACWA5Q_03070 [bacterium]
MPRVGGYGWEPEREFLLSELPQPRRRALNLKVFPKGVDNSRVDVALDPLLQTKVDELVVGALREQLKDRLPDTDSNIEHIFGRLHTGATENIGRIDGAESPRARAQLYQLGLLKYVLSATDREIELIREELDAARNQDGTQNSTSVTAAQQALVELTRNRKSLRYRAVRRVLLIQKKIEHRGLRKIRKSLLGMSWPAPEEDIFNPLLQLGTLTAESEFLKIYPLVFLNPQDFLSTNRVLCNAFRKWLPAECDMPPVDSGDTDMSTLVVRRDSGELPGYVEIERFLKATLASGEFKHQKISWLDEPHNLEQLLGGTGDHWPDVGPWHNKYWPAYQKSLISGLDNRLSKEGLVERILYSLEMENLMLNSELPVQASTVYQYLNGDRSRKSLLSQMQGYPAAEAYVQRCDDLKKQVKGLSTSERQRRLVIGLVGFAELRRDLKCAWDTYRAMDRIRLLETDADKDLSRTNALLREFPVDLSDADKINPAVGTVIMKADLRGSTSLTAEMRARDLNPASYFSENLFKPVNQLLESFGAIKVFIEGDAIIVALLQYENPDPDNRVVARACGLAYRMLEVVRSKNSENRRHRLPELELGIGIAYIDEAPTYLFDGQHRITISPAINRADRLSSCDSKLHRHKLAGGENGWGVELVKQGPCGDNDTDATLMRYNVNGIELDLTSYRKLQTELTLKKVKSESLGGGITNRYYLGRFPDVSGKMSWLIVREAPVRVWDGSALHQDEGSNQRFYEVVSDSKLIAKVRAKLS